MPAALLHQENFHETNGLAGNQEIDGKYPSVTSVQDSDLQDTPGAISIGRQRFVKADITMTAAGLEMLDQAGLTKRILNWSIYLVALSEYSYIAVKSLYMLSTTYTRTL